MRKYLLLIIILTGGISLFSQTKYTPVEVLIYNGYYNWGFIWVKAGRVEFNQSHSSKYPQAERLSVVGRSLPSWDWVFYIRDTLITTYNKKTFIPYESYRVAREGKSYHKVFNYRYDYRDSLIYLDIHRIGKYKKRDTIKMQPDTHDMLSIAWKARNLDFDRFSKNQIIPINMILDEKIYNLYIRYLGIETIKADGIKQECYVFSPLLVEGTVFKSGEDMKIWVSKDQFRVPLMVEAKILVGSVKAIIDRQASKF